MSWSAGSPQLGDVRCNYAIQIVGLGLNKYPAKQHARAVVHHLRLSQGLIYLAGQAEIPIEDSDMTYPFRQRRYFYYLSGVKEPSCCLTYDIERDYLLLYIPPINPSTVIWFGRGLTLDEAKDKYDVDAVHLTTSLSEDILHWLKIAPNHQRKLYVLHKDQIPHSVPIICPPADFDSDVLIAALDSSRAIKSPHEISLIRHAIRVSSIAHRSVLHHITSLRTEAEIHALYLDICIAHGAKSQGYAPIIASGTNASTLHYTKNDENLKGKGLVCMDAGCEWECYSSDITRTFPIQENGWVSKEAENIYGIVQEMQERCIEKLRPGIRYLDLHYLAHRIAAEGLIRLGIFRKNVSVDAVLNSGASKGFFPHGLGHHLGLEVHDVSGKPLLGFNRNGRGRNWFDEGEHCVGPDVENNTELHRGDPNKRPRALCELEEVLLQENMVLTVEPGIYFSPYTLNKFYLSDPEFERLVDKEVLDKYMHVGGVRIEDDILITAQGYENLTQAPKGKEMLDIIHDGAKCKHGRNCHLNARNNQD